MITSLKNNDIITIKMFGKEKDVYVFCTGDNKFDETGHYKAGDFDLTQEELDVLNWFLENVRIEDYLEEILDYINNEYSMWSDTVVGIEDIEDEIDIQSIAINVTKIWKSDDGEMIYPEISFYGECECDDEHGICIGFRDKEFLGIAAQDWTL